MQRAFLLLLAAAAATCASTTASAGNVGVYLGVPAPVYAAPPPIFNRPFWPPAYQSYPPPVVYQAPPVVYGPPPGAYGYGYQGGFRGGDRDRREWHDNGWRKGGEHRRQGDDD